MVIHLGAVVPGVGCGISIVGDHGSCGAFSGRPGVRGDAQPDLSNELFLPSVGQFRAGGGAVVFLIPIQVPLVLDDLAFSAIRTSRIQGEFFADLVSIRALDPSQHWLWSPRIRIGIGRAVWR